MKERKKKNKLVEKVVEYLQDIQNLGGCNCGRADCPLNAALFLMEECQIPVEKVAEIFVCWQMKFLQDLASRTR